MAFRIKDLMISVVPPGVPVPFPGCHGVSLPNCGGSSLACLAFSLPQCAVSLPHCGLSLPHCGGVSLTNCGASLFGGCGNEYTCNGCTNTCDAGCSRIQCSNYPTNKFPARELADLRAAQLALLKAELRLAQDALDLAGTGAAAQSEGPEDLARLEKQMEEALKELRVERARVEKGAKKGKSTG